MLTWRFTGFALPLAFLALSRLARGLSITIASAALLVCLALFSSSTAHAAELTGFLAVAQPGERWAGGAGGAFGMTFFKLVHFEAEVAHLPGEILDQSQWSAVGSASHAVELRNTSLAAEASPQSG